MNPKDQYAAVRLRSDAELIKFVPSSETWYILDFFLHYSSRSERCVCTSAVLCNKATCVQLFGDKVLAILRYVFFPIHSYVFAVLTVSP